MSSEKSDSGTQQNENLTNNSQTNLSNTRINHYGSRTTNQTNFPHPSTPVLATKDDMRDDTGATNVQKLLEFYRALAPVCIGPHSSTTLELELSAASNAAANKSKHLASSRNQEAHELNENYLKATETNRSRLHKRLQTDIPVSLNLLLILFPSSDLFSNGDN
jgi:hypothetical protein